jgi:hypothetical protein
MDEVVASENVPLRHVLILTYAESNGTDTMSAWQIPEGLPDYRVALFSINSPIGPLSMQYIEGIATQFEAWSGQQREEIESQFFDDELGPALRNTMHERTPDYLIVTSAAYLGAPYGALLKQLSLTQRRFPGTRMVLQDYIIHFLKLLSQEENRPVDLLRRDRRRWVKAHLNDDDVRGVVTAILSATHPDSPPS